MFVSTPKITESAANRAVNVKGATPQISPNHEPIDPTATEMSGGIDTSGNNVRGLKIANSRPIKKIIM
jgi:hypothetical protein